VPAGGGRAVPADIVSPLLFDSASLPPHQHPQNQHDQHNQHNQKQKQKQNHKQQQPTIPPGSLFLNGLVKDVSRVLFVGKVCRRSCLPWCSVSVAPVDA
jgi:hypothetical protein